MTILHDFDLKAELAKCKTADDFTGKNGLLQKLVGGFLEQLLQSEMGEHLGYEKHSSIGDHSGNSRNGKTKKSLKSNYGNVEIEIPRDRNGDFTPLIVKKHQRSISSFDDKIISMHAKGMSVRNIQSHVEELYGTELSPTTISNITEKVMDLAKEWQSRPLQGVYAIIFFNAIHYKDLKPERAFWGVCKSETDPHTQTRYDGLKYFWKFKCFGCFYTTLFRKYFVDDAARKGSLAHIFEFKDMSHK